MKSKQRDILGTLFTQAIRAADPETALAKHLPAPPKGRTIVIGAGKGAAQLGAAFESLWQQPLAGTIVTRYGYATPCKSITVIEASHPVPDHAGLNATKALFETVKNLDPDDLVVALISGGGSALLPSPPEGLTFDDDVALNQVLLASGAPISAMNAIRKQLSKIKGGRLAAACAPARVVSLIVSDVPGDDPAQVASGPTVPDTTDRADALAAIKAYNIALPANIMAYLENAPEDAPSPDNPAFIRNEVHVIASAARSLEAAAAHCQSIGLQAVILSDAIEGESREIAKMHAAIARQTLHNNRPFSAPVVLLSGGETTVTLRGEKWGKGGRNSEFALAFALEIEGSKGITALAADTDGIDGSQDNAGAFVDGTTTARLRALGHDPVDYLSRNDAYSALAHAGDLFMTGPTGTNVNDFRAILIDPRPQ
ncbi:MAG: glycerate kinase [Rhodobacterales bacterium]|nr:glycerate kinase [Rhodobacterales bacterium]